MVSIKDFSYLSAFYHVFRIFFSKDPGNVGTNIWIGRYVAISTSSAIYSGLRPPFSIEIITLTLRTTFPSNMSGLTLN